MKVVKSLVLSAILGLSFLNAANYKVDTSHSNVAFKVKHMMVSYVKGSFEKFNGSFSIDEDSKQFSAIDGTVEVASITTKNDKRDNHLRSEEFFNVAKYPTMRLKLIKQNGDKGEFELTIKNVTKVVVVDIKEISGPIKDPWGNTRMGFELSGKINRKDFNINFNKVLETGGLLVGDIVKFDIAIEGIKIK